MLVFKCKIKILIIYQLTYILYHFKANYLYFKYSWIIKAKQTSLAHINWKCHSSWEINIPLTLRVRGILISQALVSFSNNIAHSVSFAIVFTVHGGRWIIKDKGVGLFVVGTNHYGFKTRTEYFDHKCKFKVFLRSSHYILLTFTKVTQLNHFQQEHYFTYSLASKFNKQKKIILDSILRA